MSTFVLWQRTRENEKNALGAQKTGKGYIRKMRYEKFNHLKDHEIMENAEISEVLMHSGKKTALLGGLSHRAKRLFLKGMEKQPGIDGILVTVGLCIIALLLCVVMKDSLQSFIETIVTAMTTEAQKILTGVSG